MDKSHCTLEVTSVDGVTSKIVLNGTDVSMQCSKFEFRHVAGEIAEATMTFIVDDIRFNVLGKVSTKIAKLQ